MRVRILVLALLGCVWLAAPAAAQSYPTLKPLAPHFAGELEAAGLFGLSFSWGSDGAMNLDALTPAQRTAVIAVYDAHNAANTAAATAYANSHKDKEVDAGKLARAVADWARRELNIVRGALPTPLPAITVNEALNGRPEQPLGIKQIYRALP